MSTVRQMLPAVAQPFTEAIVGAGLGALVSKFFLKGDMSTGAIVGGVAGYGIALTKARGAFPFTVTTGGFYAGQDAAALPAVDASGQQPIVEPVIEEVVAPDWHRHRRDDWWRGAYGHGGYGHGGWGHGRRY